MESDLVLNMARRGQAPPWPEHRPSPCAYVTAATGHPRSATGRNRSQPVEGRRRYGGRSHRPALALSAHRLLQPHGRGLLLGLRAALVCRAHGSFAARHSAKGLTEYQWRVLKRAVRDRFDQPDHLLNLAAGRNAIRDVVEAAMQKPSRQRRVRAARFLQTAPSLANEPDPSGRPSAEGTAMPQATLPTTQPSEPAVPESNGDNGSHRSDPSEVNVDDWEVASPDL